MTDRDTYAEPEYLSIGEAARLLGVSVETVRRWERDDRIACIRTLGNQRRFTREEVERVKSGAAA